jgi:hypothetical protein
VTDKMNVRHTCVREQGALVREGAVVHGQWWVVAGRLGKKGNGPGPRDSTFF